MYIFCIVFKACKRLLQVSRLFKGLVHCRKELDSELLDDKSTVRGVVCADGDGLCIAGEILLVTLHLVTEVTGPFFLPLQRTAKLRNEPLLSLPQWPSWRILWSPRTMRDR